MCREGLIQLYCKGLLEFCLSSHPDVACIGLHSWLHLLAAFPQLPRTQCPRIADKLWQLLHSRYAHTHFRCVRCTCPSSAEVSLVLSC